MRHFILFVDNLIMSKVILNPKLKTEVETLKAKYINEYTGFRWFLFKLMFWRLASELDQLKVDDIESVQAVVSAYKNAWFIRLSDWFDICLDITHALFYKILNHPEASVSSEVIAHPNADDLSHFLDKSPQHRDLYQKLVDLLPSEEPAQFARLSEKLRERSEKEIKTRLDLIALSQNRPGLFLAPCDNKIIAIIETPDIFTPDIDFFKLLDQYREVPCTEATCQQIVKASVLKQLLHTIINAKVDDRAKKSLVAQLMALSPSHNLINLMSAHLDSPTVQPREQEIDFIHHLIQFVNHEQLESILKDNALLSLMKTIIASSDAAQTLIKTVLAFSDKDDLRHLITTYPTIDIMSIIQLQSKEWQVIKRMIDNHPQTLLQSIFESQEKWGFLLDLIKKGNQYSVIEPLLEGLAKIENPKALAQIIRQLVNKKALFQDNLVETIRFFMSCADLDLYCRMTAEAWVTQTVINALALDEDRRDCMVALFKTYPSLQLDEGIVSMTSPRSFKELCLTLKQKNLLLESDVNVMIHDERLRRLLSTLVNKPKTDLTVGCIAQLASHHSRSLVYDIMESASELEIMRVMALDYVSLTQLLALINQGVSRVDIGHLMQANRFQLYRTLLRLKNVDADSNLVTKLTQITVDRAQIIERLMIDLGMMGQYQADSIESLLLTLLQHKQLELLQKLVKEIKDKKVLPEGTDETRALLSSILRIELMNTCTPLLMTCLLEKHLLDPANLVSIITLMASWPVFFSNQMMDLLDDMHIKQLTPKHAPSLLRLLSCALNSAGQLSTVDVQTILSIIPCPMLLAQLVEHKNAIQLIKRLLELQDSNILDEDVIRYLIDSENGFRAIQLLQAHGLLTKPYMTAMMASQHRLNVMLQMHQDNKLTPALLPEILTLGTDIFEHKIPASGIDVELFINAMLVLHQHHCLNAEYMTSLFESNERVHVLFALDQNQLLTTAIWDKVIQDNVFLRVTQLFMHKNRLTHHAEFNAMMLSETRARICVMLEPYVRQTNMIWDALFQVNSARLDDLLSILETLKMNNGLQEGRLSVNDLLKVINHSFINELKQLMASITEPALQQSSQVYSLMINHTNTPTQLAHMKKLIHLLKSNGLSAIPNAPSHFEALVNLTQSLEFDEQMDRLSRKLLSTQEKEQTFEKIKAEGFKTGVFSSLFKSTPSPKAPASVSATRP